MHSCLLTGGAGFIGSCLIRQLIGNRKTRVVNFDKLTYAGNMDSLESVIHDPLHQFVQGDICDRSVVEDVLETCRPSAIIHLAAESHVDRSIDGPGEFVGYSPGGNTI